MKQHTTLAWLKLEAPDVLLWNDLEKEKVELEIETKWRAWCQMLLDWKLHGIWAPGVQSNAPYSPTAALNFYNFYSFLEPTGSFAVQIVEAVWDKARNCCTNKVTVRHSEAAQSATRTPRHCSCSFSVHPPPLACSPFSALSSEARKYALKAKKLSGHSVSLVNVWDEENPVKTIPVHLNQCRKTIEDQ